MGRRIWVRYQEGNGMSSVTAIPGSIEDMEKRGRFLPLNDTRTEKP